ncbi:hypothetical protein FACS189438_1650 [Bacteroidia bacterium]|nr:hypothetical protein FACS189438_1650 [Bacteroidia bacterium]
MQLEKVILLFKPVHGKMKAFASRFQWKKAFTFLFFLLLSFTFWALQSMQEEYETQLVVPVTYKDIPLEMAFTNTPPAFITARVRDKGSVLLNYKFKKRVINIDVNKPSGGTILLSSGEIETLLMKQLTPTTSLLKIDPQKIEISYAKRVEKQLPVAFNGQISTAPGYIISGEIKYNPPAVDVYAGNVVMDSLHEIRTEYTEIKNANKTIIRKLKLLPVEGAAIIPNVVSVSIPIEEYTEKTFEIKVTAVHVPAGYAMRIFPATVKVTCNVPLSLFKELEENAFSVETSFAALNPDSPGILPLKLARKPAWLERATLSQESVEFILEQIK